jgi:hypothetical protein
MAKVKKDQAKVRIRMYRQGLGDCFLLTFFTGKERNEVHMLIDCGSIGKGETGAEMEDVIEDIRKTTDDHLHTLVVTHEHADHVSGFNNRLEQKRRFEAFTIENVWLAWTENRESVLDAQIPPSKIKDDTLTALALTVQTIRNKADSSPEEGRVLQDLAAAADLLGLGAGPLGDDQILAAAGPDDPPLTVNGAMKYASGLAGKDPEYLKPGDMKLLDGWRFYVLGPPQAYNQLKRLEDEGELYLSASQLAGTLAASGPFLASSQQLDQYRKGLDGNTRGQFDAGFPFDARFRIETENEDNSEAYKHLALAYERDGWRRIDYDWLASIGDLALQMDNMTNNTSLVLAMECLEDGRVLLFPGDAQLGNWETWDGTLDATSDHQYPIKFRVPKPRGRADELVEVSSTDLLKKTVFYKVGHHSSHNATTIAGLEKMNTGADGKISREQTLVAVIPVDSKTAANKGTKGWNMPDPELYLALLEKTQGHVLRSDMGWPFIKDDSDETQKPPLWKEPSLWTNVKKKILEFQAGIQANIKSEPVTNDNTNVSRVYRDPQEKFIIEYQQNKAGNINGLYIDYFLF